MKMFLCLSLLAVVFTLSGCESSPESADAPENLSGGESSETEQAPYYTGDGGKGMSIAVIEPTGKDLGKDVQYLLPQVQGSITGDFDRYSDMTVIDRQNIDKIIAEQLHSASVSSDEEAVRIGKLSNAQYIATGSITRTPSNNYLLELAVSHLESGERKASYPPTPVSLFALENLSAIKTATADLLAQLGVHLTERAKAELSAPATQQAIESQTALSKGIEAMRKGTVVEAQSYFIQAQTIDPQLAEAASRVNIVSRDISSGNIGADARNRQAWHDDWVARLAECEKTVTDYFRNTPVPTYLVYDTAIKEENHDYNRGTLTLSCGDIALYTASESWPAPAMGVVDAVYAGLRATKQADVWGVGNWPNYSAALREKTPSYETVVELVNEEGAVIGKQSVTLRAGWSTGFDGGRTRARKSETSTALRFSNVDAKKITNRLSVRIASLNRVDAEKAAKANSVSIITLDEYKKTPAYFVTRNCEFKDGALTKCTGDLKTLDGVIPAWFNGQPVTGIAQELFIYKGPRDFSEYKSGRTRAVVPGSVTSIGAGAFAEEMTVNNWGFIPGLNLFLAAKGEMNLYEYPDNFSVSLPANISFGRRVGVMDSLADFYNENGRKAGTYTTLDGENWRYSARR